jgi:hypothetical protein
LVVYGGLGAALVDWGLWTLAQPIWQTGSLVQRAVFIGLVAVAVAIVVNDIQRRRFSLLSGLLATLWAAAVALIVLLELFASG